MEGTLRRLDSWKCCGRVRCIIWPHLNRPPTQRIPTEKDFSENSKLIFHPTNPIFQWPERVPICRCKRKFWFEAEFSSLRSFAKCRAAVKDMFSFTFSHKNHSQAIKNVFTTSNIWRSTYDKKKIEGGFKSSSNFEQVLQEFACFGNAGKFGKNNL